MDHPISGTRNVIVPRMGVAGDWNGGRCQICCEWSMSWRSLVAPLALLLISAHAMRANFDNCKSPKLRELVLETVGMYPHQYSYQAKYLKQQAELRFGNWWSAVIVSDRGGYGMSAIYDEHKNTSCEMMLFDTFYWIGRTC